MSWQDRLRDLGERLASGEITTAEYRRVSEEILAEADAEAAAETAPESVAATQPVPAAGTRDETVTQTVAEARETAAGAVAATAEAGTGERPKVRIPVSAAWEAPSGEMTQIVGTHDKTTVVSTLIADKLTEPGEQAG
jgi:hypothetical protein